MSSPPPPPWRPAGSTPLLPPGEVHVWRVPARRAGGAAARASGERLSPEEESRARRFHRDEDRDRWVAAHAALRRLLAGYTGRPAAEIRYRHGPHGKPSLDPPSSPLLEFNISHSGSWALCAFALGRRVGVDVEEEKEWRDLDAIAARYFSHDEVAALLAIAAAGERRRAFYRCWSRKEAWIKATGRGIGAPLGGFTVSLEEDERASLLRVSDTPGEAERWCMEALPVGPGYAAALAIESPRPLLRLFELADG